MHPRRPDVFPFGSKMARSRDVAKFWEKCNEWPQARGPWYIQGKKYAHNMSFMSNFSPDPLYD